MKDCSHSPGIRKANLSNLAIEKIKVYLIRFKLDIAMKITALFLTVCILQASAFAEAQVTIKVENASLESVFNLIKKQTGILIFYNQNDISDAKKITLDLKQAPLSEVLDLCVSGQNLKYSIEGNSVFVSRKEKVISVTRDRNLPDSLIQIQGKVLGADNKGVAGATVAVRGSDLATSTQSDGSFTLNKVKSSATLTISSIGYEPKTVRVNGESNFSIKLEVVAREMKEITIVNTGFEQVPKERSTGSFVKIDEKLLNRSVGTNILNRLDGITSGVLFNRAAVGNVPSISIRGRSTIFANAEPLIVLDNFPYQGRLENINPNDIESVTILKDAAAASIWGSLSGNGVIVITTKKGKLGQPLKISVNSNLTIGARPDLNYQPKISNKDYIEVERFQFNNGRYDPYLNWLPWYPQSPVVDILQQIRDHSIDSLEGEKMISKFEGINANDALSKYFYRNSINQQYSLNLSGGSNNNAYFLSAGYDKNIGSTVGNSFQRFTINGSNSIFLLDQKLELTAGVIFTGTKELMNTQNYIPKFPYEQIGTPDNPLATVRDYRRGYVDTVGGGKLLDWHYYPLKERDANNTNKYWDYKINANASYKIIEGLKATASFQYGKGIGETTTDYGQDSYVARNLVNRFTQIDPTTGKLSTPIPLGNVIIRNNNNYNSNSIRLGLSFNKTISEIHAINAIAGVEQREVNAFSSTQGLYGYDPSTATSAVVDFLTNYTTYVEKGTEKIQNYDRDNGTVDRFRSIYFNGSYSYDSRYSASISIRRDESNLFGVKTNQKGIPLWSAGVSWIISNEKFYESSLLPYLRFRATLGYNGNVDKSTYAFTTVRIESFNNTFSAPLATVVNPPNPSLKWERVKMYNVAIDFGSRNNTLNGSIEVFQKNGIDLIGFSPLAPQIGIIQYKGNVANTRTRGIDVILNTKNINRSFKWNTNFILSYVNDRVTNNKVKQRSNLSYVDNNYSNPLEGKPFSSVFSFSSSGLDTLGNPIGFIDGKESNDYNKIINSTNSNELVYHGSAVPTFFGSIRNTLEFKQFELSFNVVFKAGYYYRRPSLDYGQLFFNGTLNQQEYSQRWQKKGDEKQTYVPSLIYPNDDNRDLFYRFSSVLVERADHIRLQDFQLAYNLPIAALKKIGISNAKLYLYANNLWILWRANSHNIDPDVITGIPTPKTYSLGLRLDM